MYMNLCVDSYRYECIKRQTCYNEHVVANMSSCQ